MNQICTFIILPQSIQEGTVNALLSKELLKLVKIAKSAVEKASWSLKSAAAAGAPCKKKTLVFVLCGDTVVLQRSFFTLRRKSERKKSPPR